MDIGLIIAHRYPQADISDYTVVQEPDSAPELIFWNEAALGPRPTEAQLRAAWLPALKEQKVAEIRSRAAEEAEKLLPHRQALYLTRTRVANPRLAAWEAVCKKESGLIVYIEDPKRTEAELLAVSW